MCFVRVAGPAVASDSTRVGRHGNRAYGGTSFARIRRCPPPAARIHEAHGYIPWASFFRMPEDPDKGATVYRTELPGVTKLKVLWA